MAYLDVFFHEFGLCAPHCDLASLDDLESVGVGRVWV